MHFAARRTQRVEVFLAVPAHHLGRRAVLQQLSMCPTRLAELRKRWHGADQSPTIRLVLGRVQQMHAPHQLRGRIERRRRGRQRAQTRVHAQRAQRVDQRLVTAQSQRQVELACTLQLRHRAIPRRGLQHRVDQLQHVRRHLLFAERHARLAVVRCRHAHPRPKLLHQRAIDCTCVGGATHRKAQFGEPALWCAIRSRVCAGGAASCSSAGCRRTDTPRTTSRANGGAGVAQPRRRRTSRAFAAVQRCTGVERAGVEAQQRHGRV